MRKFMALGSVCLITTMVVTAPAAAVPSFARLTGLTCNQCHVQFTPNPDFTMTAKKFRYNAYRTPWVYDKMQAGQEGAISGRRLVLNLVNYFSMGFEHTLMGQSKAPYALGATPTEPSVISSGYDSNLTTFYSGPITDRIGVWNEIYYSAAGSDEQNPFRYVAHDEIDLRMAWNPGGNIVGWQITSEPLMTTYGMQFNSTAAQHELQGGVAQAHSGRIQFGLYGFWKDRLLTVFAASPGEDDFDWDRANFTGLLAYAFKNKDSNELWYEGYVKVGNDAIPSVTGISIDPASRAFTYRTLIRNLQNLTSTKKAYTSADVGDIFRTYHQIEYGFIDRGPWSLRGAIGVSKTHETYSDGGIFDEGGFGINARWNYDRTWEWQLGFNKRYEFTYTDPAGVKHDIDSDIGINARFHRRLAMNFVTFLVASNSQTLDLTQNWKNGWSWNFGFDYYF